jgi:uncharacterized membrane protein YjfL (UPF0719 family)
LDDDETFILFLFSAVTIMAAARWYLGVLRIETFGRGRGPRVAMGILPILCAIAAYLFIRADAAREVRASSGLIALFTAGEIVALTVVWMAMRILGISVRDDVIERKNPAAAIAVCGAATGATIAYCGANVGEGATIYTTLGPAILAIATMLLLWFVHEILSHPAESIVVDRDVPSAVRLAGMLVAIGLVLARAVAGDWKSIDATLAGFRRIAWPAIVLMIFAMIMQRHGRSSLRNSLVTAVGGVGAALIWVLTRGRP